MRILIDARLYGLENAGLGRYVMNLVRHLSELDPKNEYVILLRKNYFNRLKLPERWTAVKSDFRHYGVLEQILLPLIIMKHKPDVVHFPHFNIPLLCPKPFVVTIHDILMHKQKGLDATTLPAFLYYFKRLGYGVVFRRAVMASRVVIVPSNFVKKEIADYYKVAPEKIKVTYEGLDEAISLKGSVSNVLKNYKVEMPYFIYSGNAYPHKNLKRLIEATLELNQMAKEKSSLLIISARNVFTKRLTELVKKMRVGSLVKLLGFVSDHDLAVLYNKSEAFIFPSISEGFGLPGLEAMATGTLALVSDIPVFREVYKGAATYFNPYDFSSMARAMKDVLEMDKGERRERVERGQEFVKRYSWRKMAEETLEIYGQTISKPVLKTR